MSDKITHVTDATFEQEVLQSDKPVLVDFWAPWCGPCKMLSPIVDAYAEEHDHVKVVKINVDEAKETPAKFGVRGIPTLLVVKDGQVAGTKVGGMSKTDLADFVDQHK